MTLFLLYSYEWLPDLRDDPGDELTGPKSRHYTMLFNIFVLFQVFNEYNARFLRGEWAIWRGLDRNPLFLMISIGTMVFQVVMVQFAAPVLSPALKIHKKGLTPVQWLICLGFGAGTLVVQQLLNLFKRCIGGLCCRRHADTRQSPQKVGKLDNKAGCANPPESTPEPPLSA